MKMHGKKKQQQANASNLSKKLVKFRRVAEKDHVRLK